MSVEIRAASPADLERLAAKLPHRSRELHRRRLEAVEREGAVYLVAWIGDTATGHALVRAAGRRGHPELEDLFVLEPFRGRGIGSRLLDAAETCAGRAMFGFGVEVSNDVARRMYERRGYTKVSSSPFTLSYTYWDETGAERQGEMLCDYYAKEL